MARKKVMTSQNFIACALVLLVLGACANGPCRPLRNPDLAERAGGIRRKPETASLDGEAADSKSDNGGSVGAPAVPLRDDGLKKGTTRGATPAEESSGVSAETTVFVFKPDGSLQCGVAKGLSKTEMAAQLSGISIVSSEKRSDGLMHIQACGTPTGQINVYEIPSSQLKKAERLEFKKVP